MWDITIFDDVTYEAVVMTFTRHCKKWVFQKEETKEHKAHYQCRISLKKRLRQGAFVKVLSKQELWKKFHVSPTSTEIHNAQDFNYVMKNESRIEGPWMDSTSGIVIPEDVQEMKELRSWQNEIKIWATTGAYEKRKIRVIVDLVGNIGKTSIKRYLTWHDGDKVTVIPPMSDPKDFGRFVHSTIKPTTKCIIVDIPRGMTDEKQLKKLFSSIETVKDGSASEDRYKGNTKMFTPPKILIFMNFWPNREWMSSDRWDFRVIDKDNQLEIYNPNKRKEQVKPILRLMKKAEDSDDEETRPLKKGKAAVPGLGGGPAGPESESKEE